MEIEKRVEELEGEFKLIKGEVRQSLSDIRDYVLGGDLAPQPVPLGQEGRADVPPFSELPSPLPQAGDLAGEPAAYEEFEEVVDEALPAATEVPPVEGPGSQEKPPVASEEPQPEVPQAEEKAVVPDVPAVEGADTTPVKPQDLWGEEAEEEKAKEASDDDGLRETGKEEKMIGDARGSILQANQLPNLIRWVSAAKREIGSAQLPTFLEAYSVRGYLTPAMKEIILHLAVVVAEGSAEPSSADVWSRLTLELHGILSDGGR